MLLRDKAATSRNQRRWAGSWEAAVTSHNGETSRATPARSPPALRSSILLAFKADSVLTRAASWPYLLLLHDIQNKQRLRSFYPLPGTVLQMGAVVVLGAPVLLGLYTR